MSLIVKVPVVLVIWGNSWGSPESNELEVGSDVNGDFF